MSWKTGLSIFFFFVVVILLAFYWIMPFGEIVEFVDVGSGGGNFSLNADVKTEGIQFYDNMRYVSNNISYKIRNCPIKKIDEMKRGFDLLEEFTVLKFHEVSLGEEISISCEDSVKTKGRTFIAGEGGVTKVIATDNFNVIFNGEVLLIRDSQCPKPIVATHELLHALGFDHSKNPNNIMYPKVKCGQTIGEDTVNYINWLYSFPEAADLSINNVSASTQGNYLDVSITLRNDGLINSKEAKLLIYADGKKVKEINIEPIGIGGGRKLTLSKIFMLRGAAEKVKLVLDYPYSELDKKNNEIVLEIKKD